MHDRISIHPMCFMGAPFAELAQNWAKLGTRRVGLINQFLDEQGLDTVQTAVRAGDYKVETINHLLLPMGQNLDPNEETWEAPRARLSGQIQNAKALGANSIYVMSGGHGALTWSEAADCFSAVIAPCVDEAKAAGVSILVENASALFADVHIAHSLRDAVILAEIAGIGVCMDFFGSWAEAELPATIKRAAPRLGLIQPCDYVFGDRSLPCRAVPGDGAIPVRRLLGWILDTGYQGGFDLEIMGPRLDREGRLPAIARSGDRIGEILHALGA
jgi:sugar phosphate isomerase/epimerase